jgi:transaldolase
MAQRTYKAAHELLGSSRWLRAYNSGARPQRLLWASTGTKDPGVSQTLYVEALAAPFTVNTMPEATLRALAKDRQPTTLMQADCGRCEEVLAQFAEAGIDLDQLAARLQSEGAKSFVKSWNGLMDVIASKTAAVRTVA